MTRAFVGLGSNVGDRLRNLREALDDLDADGVRVLRWSSVYETDPVGPPQDDFLNAVAEVDTTLEPFELLARLKETERVIGRQERGRWGPREIDLDLLLYGDQTLSEPGLQVPHRGLTWRAFVLVPLLELAPDLDVPGAGAVADLARAAGTGGVRLVGSPDDLRRRGEAG